MICHLPNFKPFGFFDTIDHRLVMTGRSKKLETTFIGFLVRILPRLKCFYANIGDVQNMYRIFCINACSVENSFEKIRNSRLVEARKSIIFGISCFGKTQKSTIFGISVLAKTQKFTIFGVHYLSELLYTKKTNRTKRSANPCFQL